jgi:hypothetical protein
MVVWSGEGKQKSKKQWQTNNVQNKIKIKFFSSSQFIHYDFRHNYATLPANFSSPLYFNQLHDYYFRPGSRRRASPPISPRPSPRQHRPTRPSRPPLAGPRTGTKTKRGSWVDTTPTWESGPGSPRSSTGVDSSAEGP